MPSVGAERGSRINRGRSTRGGIGLFNRSILAERSFGADAYYETLVVTAMTRGRQLPRGWLATRVSLTQLLATSLLVLSGGLAALPHVRTLPHALLWATGIGGGFVMVLFFSDSPRVFGRRHLGRIQDSADF